MSEDWQKLKELFHAALEREPVKRSAFLAQACAGDDALRWEVEALIAAHEKPGSFVDTPAYELAADLLRDDRPGLLAGQQIGHYEVLGKLGAGGMGEVHLALDTQLKRKVAIKLLPAEFTTNDERVRRFGQEARAASALNHPNILTVYEVGEIDQRRYIVTEYIEGQTLRQRMASAPHGRMRLSDVLEIATQVAAALQAAHEAGITHRDIKPENVMVRQHGLVKVLDFGLAKPSSAPADSQLEAVEKLSTRDGVVMGTVSYMSPEQARGEKVDHRTDIFALGVMIYEMLAGQRPFDGTTVSDIIAAVLTKDPEPLGQLAPQVPAGLQRVVTRCLEKQPGKRFQSASDLSFALQGFAEPIATVTSILPRATSVGWIASLGVMTALIVALAIPAVRHFRETSPPEMRVEITTPATTDPISFALSPDGRQIVFVAASASGDAQSQLWLRPLDKVTAQPLAGTEGGSYPFWSPDSRSIGFFDGTKLKTIGLAGGWPQTLTDAAARGGTWNAEDGILFSRVLGTGPLFRIPASGGEPVAVTKLEKQTQHCFPQFLPGGRQFLFYALGSPETGGIYLGSLDGPETKRLTEADGAGVYHPAGWLLFVRAGMLLAARLDLARRELTGDPITVAEAVAFDARTHASALSVSVTGLLAYRQGGANRRQLVWFDRSGKALSGMGAPNGSLLAPRLSPDGRRAAVSLTVQGNTDIWLLDLARQTRLTYDASLDRFPIWSPDGSEIVFDSNRKGIRNLYRKPSNGGGSDELLVESTQNKAAYDWSADGNFIMYGSIDPQTSYDLWVLPLKGDQKPFVFLKTGFVERRGQFSPDGRWVAYLSNDSGRFEIYIRPFPGPGNKVQISTAGGAQPRWGPGGKELYFIAADGTLMAVPIAVNGATLKPGAPVGLFHTQIVGGGTDVTAGANYDISPDGRFLVNTVLEDTASPITLLQNWTNPAS